MQTNQTARTRVHQEPQRKVTCFSVIHSNKICIEALQIKFKSCTIYSKIHSDVSCSFLTQQGKLPPVKLIEIFILFTTDIFHYFLKMAFFSSFLLEVSPAAASIGVLNPCKQTVGQFYFFLKLYFTLSYTNTFRIKFYLCKEKKIIKRKM